MQKLRRLNDAQTNNMKVNKLDERIAFCNVHK